MFGIESLDDIIVIITLYLVFTLICKAHSGNCIIQSQENTNNSSTADKFSQSSDEIQEDLLNIRKR